MTAAHGSISRYTNDACRGCIPCADAWSAYMRAYRRDAASSASETRPSGALDGASPTKKTAPAMQDRDGGDGPAAQGQKEG